MNYPTEIQTEEQKTAYKAGVVRGQQEGFKRAILALQLMSMNSYEFVDNVLQNSQEAVNLRKLMNQEEL